MENQQSNFSRLKEAGLIVPDYKFTDEDRRAIESLSEEEIRMVVRVVGKLAPDWPKHPGPLRGIIL
jgi:hypothetical protein